MFWTSEYTQLRLLLFFKSNAMIPKIFRELLSVQCSWEDFRHVLSIKLSKWLKFHSWRAVFGDLPILLTMKAQIFEQAQSQLGYLGRNNNIFTDSETSLKREAGELPPTDFCQKLFTIIKVVLWSKNNFPFFFRFWKRVRLTPNWQNFELWVLSEGC